MDPNACLAQLLDALMYGDADGLVEACRDLADWVDQGGFLPDKLVVG